MSSLHPIDAQLKLAYVQFNFPIYQKFMENAVACMETQTEWTYDSVRSLISEIIKRTAHEEREWLASRIAEAEQTAARQLSMRSGVLFSINEQHEDK